MLRRGVGAPFPRQAEGVKQVPNFFRIFYAMITYLQASCIECKKPVVGPEILTCVHVMAYAFEGIHCSIPTERTKLNSQNQI